MAAKDRTIDSLRDLQRLVPAIVKEINADERLALRAAANPLLALEELGYRLTPEVRTEAERRIRFAPQTIERLSQLSEAIYSYADERFDIESPAEIERVLFEKLKLPRLDAKEQAPPKAQRKRPVQQPEPTLALQPSPSYLRRPFVDPLERLRGAHPIMEPLLEYRKLEASEPRLAPRELYERIKRGDVALPVTRLRASLKRGPASE